MKSDFSKYHIPWSERCAKLRSDYEDGAWDWLYLKAWLYMICASESFDYARETLMRELVQALESDKKEVMGIIERLEAL